MDGIDLSLVSWKDSKVVNLMSTFTGIQPIQTSTRFDRKLKKRIEIKCPAIVKEYNKHMGVVDLLDSFIGRSKIRLKSKKLYMRVFFHLVDITCANSWIIYKKIQLEKNEKFLSLPDYKTELAESLCLTGATVCNQKNKTFLSYRKC